MATVVKEQIDPLDRYVPIDGRGQTPFLFAIVTSKSVSAVIPGGFAFRVMGLFEKKVLLISSICISCMCVVENSLLIIHFHKRNRWWKGEEETIERIS